MRSESDLVAEEGPLELRLNGRPISVTLRTPGDDEDLALGFLWGEGILLAAGEYVRVEQVAEDAVDVRVAAAVLERGVPLRNFLTTSACGLCGKASLAAISAPGGVLPDAPPLPLTILKGLPDRVRAVQPIFSLTGGLHAAAWVDPTGVLRCVREDVGRHNAVDKVVGRCLAQGAVPMVGQLLFVSGRAGFELVQKAIAAGFSALVAVGAPTSLATELAVARGLGLGGFLRADGLNLYAHPRRFDLGA